MSAGRSCLADSSVLAVPWEQGSGLEPLWADPTLVPLTCLPLALLGPRLSAPWEMRCSLDHTLHVCSWCFHLSPLSGDNHENCSAVGSSQHQGKTDLSYQHGFCSAVSPAWVFLPTFFEEHSLLKHHPSSCYRAGIVAGREAASGSSARQGDGGAVVVTKEGKGHMAFHTSILLCPSW